MSETINFILETNEKLFKLAIKYGYKKIINHAIGSEDKKKEPWKYIFLSNIPIDDEFPLVTIREKENESFNQREKDLINAYINGIRACLEVLHSHGNKFKVYNLINEQDYEVISVKKNLFSSAKQARSNFIHSEIIFFEDNYYLNAPLEIFSEKIQALNYVYELLTNMPEVLYTDNDAKKQQTDALITKVHNYFQEIFSADPVYIAGNDIKKFTETFFKSLDSKTPKEVKTLKNFAVDISDRDYSKDNNDTLVGVFTTETGGLYHAYEYDVFTQIYKSKNYKSIDNYQDCILGYFLEEELFYPVASIQKFYNDYEDKKKFKKITQEILSEIMESGMALIDQSLEIENWELIEHFKAFKGYDPNRRDISEVMLPYISKSVEEYMAMQNKLYSMIGTFLDYNKFI